MNTTATPGKLVSNSALSTEYLTPPEAAAFTRLAVQTLAKLRVQGGGPPYVKISRRVVYGRAALQAWMDARVCSSTSERTL